MKIRKEQFLINRFRNFRMIKSVHLQNDTNVFKAKKRRLDDDKIEPNSKRSKTIPSK